MQLDDIIKITGLPFKRNGSRLIAACRIDGTSHSRPDKTTAKYHPQYGIVIAEQGGECLGLNKWIETYGDGQKVKVEFKTDNLNIERFYVDQLHFQSSLPKVYKGNLFTFLSDKFGKEKTLRSFREYAVGESGAQESIFWYTKDLNNICHDARILYQTSGKRVKNKGGGYRKHVPSDGYSYRCLFGEHLTADNNKEVCIVESEKTALIMSIVDDNRVWLATGGSNKTSLIDFSWSLFPDFDNAGSFWECIGCKNRNKQGCIIRKEENGTLIKDWGCSFANPNLRYWWKGLNINSGDDVADYIIKNRGYGK